MRRLLPLAALLCLALAPAARADVFGPPSGKVFTGLSGSTSTSLFSSQVGKHPAVFGFFTQWWGSNQFTPASARESASPPMLPISTNPRYGEPERVPPLGIARGVGDRYPLTLNPKIADYGE